MPYKEKPVVKKYFAIGEVAKELGVAPSLIRHWETQFDFIRPKKNAKGNRKFTQDDLEKLKYVHHLVKEKKYKLQGARDHIKNGKYSVEDKSKMIASLQKIRSFLEEMQNKLP